MSRSHEHAGYSSTKLCQSVCRPGVAYVVRKMSLRRRAALASALAEIGPRLEFTTAGSTAMDQLETTRLLAAAAETYLKWGLLSVEGLDVDGEPATIETLLDRGPEDLCDEIVQSIQAECRMSEDEVKN